MTLDVPSQATALQAFNVTLTVRDQLGNVATGYRGTVTFSSSDLLAQLPSDYTFTSGDGGKRTFSVTLVTVGPQTIGADDVANSSLGTTSPPVTVTLPGL